MDGFFSSSMGTTISFLLEYLADCYAEKRVRYNVISGPHRICGEWNSPYPLEIVGREWIRRTPTS